MKESPEHFVFRNSIYLPYQTSNDQETANKQAKNAVLLVANVSWINEEHVHEPYIPIRHGIHVCVKLWEAPQITVTTIDPLYMYTTHTEWNNTWMYRFTCRNTCKSCLSYKPHKGCSYERLVLCTYMYSAAKQVRVKCLIHNQQPKCVMKSWNVSNTTCLYKMLIGYITYTLVILVVLH